MWATILIILNLFILEVSLSLDNIAVLAIMVKDLPGDDSKKALKWGMWGAYIMRGLCLLLAGYLVSMWPLKLIGGIYLLYLCYGFFTKADDTVQEDVSLGNQGKMYGWLTRNTGLSFLWITIILVEVADMTFSIDNIFAAVALSPNIWLVLTGVFLGIAVMRFIAGWFVTLIKKYPTLETSAFVVIGLLGVKLIITALASWFKVVSLNELLSHHSTDIIFSIGLMFVFFIPLLYSYVKNPQTSG